MAKPEEEKLASEIKKELVLLEIAIADMASNPDVTIEQLEQLKEALAGCGKTFLRGSDAQH
jgi:hypothetical protein